jgi:hypothetical protein
MQDSLACILHEGNEAQGKSGTKSPGAILDALLRGPKGVRRRDAPNKQGRTIASRSIAKAMDQGGSFEIGRQIFPDFVQVQSVL